MGNLYSIKIDAYSHISPPKYTKALQKVTPDFFSRVMRTATLFDLEERFKVMDKFEGLVQVLTIGPVPPLEAFANPKQSVELAKLANDEMAELVQKYRERFVAAIALLPMNDLEAALKETDRAIKDLGCRGVYIHSNINGKPLDSPEFLPLFEKMIGYNMPIFIHPWRNDEFADYQTEDVSKYHIVSVFGWPYETTVAMTRLIFSGIMEKHPNLKIITHHGGGVVPYLEQRILQHYGASEKNSPAQSSRLQGLSKPPLDYFKMFYTDTALYGNTPALMCAYNFYGDHLLFGADFPLGDYYLGLRSYRQTINAIEEMAINDTEKKKIFMDNALNLLRIPL